MYRNGQSVFKKIESFKWFMYGNQLGASKQTNERTEKDPIVDVCYGFSPMVGDFDQAAKNQKTSIFCSIHLND